MPKKRIDTYELKQVQARLRITMYQIDEAKRARTRANLWAQYDQLLSREMELMGHYV